MSVKIKVLPPQKKGSTIRILPPPEKNRTDYTLYDGDTITIFDENTDSEDEKNQQFKLEYFEFKQLFRRTKRLTILYFVKAKDK